MTPVIGHPSSAAQLTGSRDSREYRRALGRFATGVVVVTAIDRDEVRGATVNGFVSVSLDPPLVLVSLAETSRLHDALRADGRYVANVLAADQRELAWH